MSATVNSSLRGEQINVTLDHPLDKALFDLPLTLKTYVNPAWRSVNVKQGNSIMKANVQREGSSAFAMYRAAPGRETIEISEAR